MSKKEKNKKKIRTASLDAFTQEEIEQLLQDRKIIITAHVENAVFFLFYSPTTNQKWVMCYSRSTLNPLKEKTEERHSLWIQSTFTAALRFACYFAILHGFDLRKFFIYYLKRDEKMLSILNDLITDADLWKNQHRLDFNEDIFEKCRMFEENNDIASLSSVLSHEYVPAYNLSHHGSEELIRNCYCCVYAVDQDDSDVSYLLFYHLDRFVLMQQSKRTGQFRCSEHKCILPLQKLLLEYVEDPRAMLCMKINAQHQQRIEAFARSFQKEQHS